MEPNKTRKLPYILTGTLLAACVGASLIFWAYGRAFPKTALSALTRGDLPILDLKVQFITLDGKEVPAEQVRLRDAGQESKGEALFTEPDQKCPELRGGDTNQATDISDLKNAEGCPNAATWQVIRHPIALSLYFQDGRKLLSLFDDNARARELSQSKFVQGVFYDPLHSAGVRAEDLRLEGLQGAFLKQLIRESLSAHAELHYDIAHGKKGFVYSFVRDECPFAAKALPLIGQSLARSGYRVSALKEPILEMRIGLQRLFLTEYDDRVYLANGLEALLNVMESLGPSSQSLPQAPVVFTLRAEAFLQKIVPAMVGSQTFDMSLGLDLSGQAPGTLRFPAGKYSNHLHPKIFKGVLASIPHDAFAAVVTSFYLPPDMSGEQWRQLAAEGPGDQPAAAPEDAGFAIVWDLGGQGKQTSNVGVIIANQSTPDEASAFKRYFSHPELTAECGGGTVFLAASSQNLLARMKECCAGQSLSILDWERGARKGTYDAAQLLLFMSPGGGMREVFLAGGARSGDMGEFEPQWKQQYEQAKAALRAEGEKVFSTLHIVAFSGAAAPASDTIQLNGFFVQQGASR